MRHAVCSCGGVLIRRLLKLSFGVGFAIFLTTVRAWGADEEDDNNFQQDVIECEEALAKLDQCCPDFDSTRVLCNYYYAFSGGCGSSTTEKVSPAFNKEESNCIRDTDCNTLQTKNVCKRAQEAKPYSSKVTTGNSIGLSDASTTRDERSTHPPVCP